MPTTEPYNLHAEQSVIGALLLDNDAVERMGDLRSEHFYRAEHRLIFAELIKQISAGQACDVIALHDALGERIEQDMLYLHELTRNTPSAANIGRYAAIVRDRAIKRGLVALGSEFAELGTSSAEAASVLVDRAAARLEQLAQARIRNEPVHAAAGLGAHVEAMQQRLDGRGINAIGTGFADLDRRLSGGMRRGELIVLAARPKMGKTALALNIAANVAHSHTVLLLSMEMAKAQLHDRNLALLGRIPLQGVLQPAQMSTADWTGLTAAIQQIDSLRLFLDDQGGLRLLDVRMKARQLRRRHGLDVLVIDYLQLMEGEGDNRNAQIETITRGLKALAKELDIVILLLSQLNRDLEKRPNKRPQASDLRDSGAIEQDADAVIFLYRDEVYHHDSADQGVCEVDVALCRQGAPGRVALTYIAEQTRFDDAFDWQPAASPERSAHKRRGIAQYL